MRRFADSVSMMYEHHAAYVSADVTRTRFQYKTSTLKPSAAIFCAAVCALTLSVAAVAQDTTPGRHAKAMNDSVFKQPYMAQHAASALRPSASAQLTAPVSSTKEVVLHNFASPPRGAYPDWGVIRDPAGNLYGTTNGSYSDVGGGGPHNAGVVFKISPAGHETVLYSFTGGADGRTPNGVIRDSTGNLYGATTNGGALDAGVVFKIDAAGNEIVLYSFTGGTDGGNPYGHVVRDSSGSLYGITGNGGKGFGVVFKVDPSGHETVLYTFSGDADGAYPNPVILGSDGNLYGTTTYGGNAAGTAGAGVVYRLSSSGHQTVLYTFTGGKDGANSNAALLRDAGGNLYGTASAGGALGAGVVFKVDPNGHESVLYTFTGGADGGSPFAPLILDPKGNLYGTTDSGGTAGEGVVFRVTMSGHEKVLHTFVRGAVGDQPDLAGVIRDPAGNLYGTASFSGSAGQGTVYKLEPDGVAKALYEFPANEDGQHPYNNGVIFGPDERLYGSTFYGGRRGVGVVYQLDEHNDETVLHHFSQFATTGFGQPTGGVIQDEQGNLYGTTFIGQSDAGFGYGVAYKVHPDGHATLLHNFTNGADGGNPYGPLLLDSHGNLYGTANGGGASGAGVVFKIDRFGTYSVLYSFTGGTDGGFPLGGLIDDSEGNLYGTTSGGGTSGAGVVFKLDKSGHETVLYTFTGGADGGSPLAGVIRDSKGNLYGTTNGGGASGAGVVFRVDSSGHETVLYAFTGGTDGGFPLWVVLARDAAGNLYGTTAAGGESGAGVVFMIDRLGTETVLYSFTGGSDGGSPLVGVIRDAHGNLYGTADRGGVSDAGVVFKIRP